MFLILQDDTFSIKGKKQAPKRKLSAVNGITKSQNSTFGGDLKSIAGMKFRSRNGCTVCKKRKRKCDESHPICSYCNTRGLDCSYNANIKDPVTVSASTEAEEDKLEVPVNGIAKSEPEQYQLTHSEKKTSVNENQGISPMTISSDRAVFKSLQFEDFIMDNFFASPLTSHPASLPSLLLDSDGISYLDYYHHKVSQILSISTKSMNYFMSFYYSLASNEESFLYAITSWGALYAGKDDAYKKYFNMALSKFNENFSSESISNAYFRLSFGCVLVGYYACLGEVKRGIKVHDDCCQLIKKYGGPYNFAKTFHFTNEMRFILSNIQYVDIMSSMSHKHGTRFTLPEYKELFYGEELKKTELSYGIDTLQGIHQGIYLLLAGLINLKVKVNSILKELEEVKDDEHEYFKLKQKICDLFNNEVNDIEREIEEADPNYSILALAEDDECQEEYVHAFNMYKYTCELYLKLYIKRIPPKNFVIQNLVHQIMKEVDFLTETKFCVIICLPLLMCGVCCINKFDKKIVELKINKVKKLSPVLNNEKSWILIKKSWEMNPIGDLIIDWADICDDLGWYLNLC